MSSSASVRSEDIAAAVDGWPFHTEGWIHWCSACCRCFWLYPGGLHRLTSFGRLSCVNVILNEWGSWRGSGFLVFLVRCLCRRCGSWSCRWAGSTGAGLFCIRRWDPCLEVFWVSRLAGWRSWAGCRPGRSNLRLVTLILLTEEPSSHSRISISALSCVFVLRPMLSLVSAGMLAHASGFRCSPRSRLVPSRRFLPSGFQILRLRLASSSGLFGSNWCPLHVLKSMSCGQPADFRSFAQIAALQSWRWTFDCSTFSFASGFLWSIPYAPASAFCHFSFHQHFYRDIGPETSFCHFAAAPSGWHALNFARLQQRQLHREMRVSNVMDFLWISAFDRARRARRGAFCCPVVPLSVLSFRFYYRIWLFL